MSFAAIDEQSLDGITMQAFAGSAVFDRTFDEGMSLVQRASRYFDGRGREEARQLPGQIAMLYSSESLRVTTRLMQAASWLLIQRAVHEGDMAEEDARDPRYHLGSKDVCLGRCAQDTTALPNTLLDLLLRSESLYRRVERWEKIVLHSKQRGARNHFKRLEEAFPFAQLPT